MPGDVAVEGPDARVVGEVLQDDVARRGGGARLDELDVAALGVLLMDDGAVPGADALGQDVEVVPVQVHRVGGPELVLDDEPDGRVVAKVVGVPLRVEGVGDVALVGEDEHGVAGGWRLAVRGLDTGGGVGDDLLVIAAEGFSVHVEEENVGCVRGARDDEVLCCCWVRGRWEWEVRGRQIEVILSPISIFPGKAGLTYIATLAVVVGSRCRSGLCGRNSIFVIDGSQGVGLIGKIAMGAQVGAHPVGGRGRPNTLHNNVATLPDAKSHDVGRVRLDGHEVVGDDCHVVAVNGEALNTLSTTVDKP